MEVKEDIAVQMVKMILIAVEVEVRVHTAVQMDLLDLIVGMRQRQLSVQLISIRRRKFRFIIEFWGLYGNDVWFGIKLNKVFVKLGLV